MKKLILSAFMLLGIAFSAQAQEISKNALGLRLGDNDGFGGEISYQRALGSNNRLEVDLGWRNSKDVDAFKIVGYTNGYGILMAVLIGMLVLEVESEVGAMTKTMLKKAEVLF